jgi:predicted small secreted protein
MKKLTAMLLALTLCFGLAACGGNTAQDDTKDESQTVQTGKTEDKKDEAKTEEKSDETKTKTDDKTSTDSKTEDKTTETKPVTSSTNTTTAKPSAPASTSKPSASTSKPAASAPESKPAQSKPAASAPAETKPAEPAKPTASQASGYVGSSASALESALGAPTSKSYSPSCMGEGEDGIWTYDGFTVYTYKEGGSETVEAVQ